MNWALLFIAVLGALAPASTRAQVDTPIDAIRRLHGMAACVVYQNSSSSGILAVAPGSEAERALLSWIVPGCVMNIHGMGFDYQPQMLRGAIAEEVLRLGDNNRSDGRRMRWVAPFSGLTEADIGALDERGRAALQALDLAQCIEAAAPDAVAALLNTRPTDAPEERAFQALSPHLGPCLPAGAQITISRPLLRGVLAEAAYRAAYAASRRAGGPNP